MTSANLTDIILIVWFALTAVSVLYVAWDLFTSTPEMKVMKWGWILVTLYTGIVGLVVYWFSCRQPAPGSHEKFVAPLWKQTVGSTIHCLAGDATGVIVAATVTSLVGLPMWVDSVVEYVAGFTFGLFVFQALFMKDMLGGSYWDAVKSTFLPEWLSMNAVMAGMIPVMIILMTRDMSAMEPTGLRFWGIMSLATLVGAVLALPVNWWLVKTGLKHGMGTERALGKGGADVNLERERLAKAAPSEMSAMPAMDAMPMSEKEISKAEMSPQIKGAARMKMDGKVSAAAKVFITLLTIVMLAVGVFVAARYGDFSMSAKQMSEMQMNK